MPQILVYNLRSMGWYLRKSIGLGPLRLNLSKSGIGYSVGVRGARIGVNSRGTYVRMGRNGIYYQTYLDTQSRAPSNIPAPAVFPPSVAQPELANVIHTVDAASLQDSSANELLKEITSHHRKQRIAPIVLILGAVITAIAIGAGWPKWLALCFVVLVAIGHVFAMRADYDRKVVRIDYDLDPQAARSYVGLLGAMEQLRALGGFWRVSSTEVNANTKYNAGAQYSVKRSNVSASLTGPPFIATETAIFQVNAGPQQLYFLPDRLLVYQGNQIGFVNYRDLVLTCNPVQFVEAERVPFDTEIVGKTWRYANKRGGPDQRFANNPEIPVVRYASIAIRSNSGLSYVFEASNLAKAQAFVAGVCAYGVQIELRIQEIAKTL